MAEERLTLLMRARGAARARRDVDSLGDSVDRLGRRTRRANDHTGMFARGLRLLQTRLGAIIIVAGIATVVLGPPLLGVIAVLTAGLVALGGAIIPIALLVQAATARFNEMKDVTGSVAGQLAFVASTFKELWSQTTAPGADILFKGLIDVLQILMPLVKSLKGPLTEVAQAAASAGVVAATGLAALGPEISQMFREAAPLIAQIGALIPALTSALIHLAIAGMPVLTKLLEWVTAFSYWIGPAIDDAVAFANSQEFVSDAGMWWADFSGAIAFAADMIANFATIAYELYVALEPLLVLVGGALLVALIAFGDAVDWVSGHMNVVIPILAVLLTYFAPLIGYLIVLAVVTKAFAIANLLLNAVLYANPIVLVIAAVAALAVGIYFLYQRSETFRNAVAVLWEVLKHTPLGLLIGLLIRLGTKLYHAVGGVQGVANAIRTAWGAAVDFIRPKIEWLIDKIKWVIDKAQAVAGVYGKIAGGAGGVVGDVVGAIPGLASGTDEVTRGGAALVHRDEVIHLPRGAAVEPGGWTGGDGGDWTSQPVILALDGRTIAESTHRVAIKKKSTR